MKDHEFQASLGYVGDSVKKEKIEEEEGRGRGEKGEIKEEKKRKREEGEGEKEEGTIKRGREGRERIKCVAFSSFPPHSLLFKNYIIIMSYINITFIYLY